MGRAWIIIVALTVAVGIGTLLFVSGGPNPTSANEARSEALSDGAGTPTEAETSTTTEAADGPTVTVDQVPGDEPDVGSSALIHPDHESFPPPLVDLQHIRSGGPPPDGIPPIDSPKFQAASEVEWLDSRQPVLFLEIDGDARAYPVQIMTWHEIVNDTVGGLPVTVTYCPLCNSALVYDRTVGDRILDFGTSGQLYNSSLVMYDRQTESLWTHFDGQAVVGELTGTQLETLPVSTISWETFLRAHPDGLVLSRDTGFDRNYGRNPYPDYDSGEPILFDGETDGRLPAQTRVVAVRGETASIVVPLADLDERMVVNTTIDGKPIVLLHASGTASALDTREIADGRDIGAVGVFRAEIDGRTVSLEPSDTGAFIDASSGTRFDILGRGTQGELDGRQLEPVEHLDTFWFAIAAFEPDVLIVDG